MARKKNQNTSSTKFADVQHERTSSSKESKPTSTSASNTTPSSSTTPATSPTVTQMQKETTVKTTVPPTPPLIPESPAPSSATTLRESPLIPFGSLKLSSIFPSLSPLEQESDGLFSKGKEHQQNPLVTPSESDSDAVEFGLEPATEDSALSPELRALAALLSNMKGTLRAMQSTAVVLGRQTERVASIAPAIEARDDLSRLREVLEVQKKEQVEDIERLQQRLEEELKEAIKGKLREEASKALSKAIGEKVHKRVQQELNTKIPQDMRHQVRSHRRQVLEIKTNIHNMNARSFNSNIRSTTDTLRPLLRPLPSAEQSPAQLVTSTSVNSPGESSGSEPTLTENEMAPTPSENFPTTLGELWKLSADRAKQLVEDYGLGVGSPLSVSTSSKSAPTSASADAATGEREDHINRFMDHIGVPFKILPVPVSASRYPVGQRLLSPVIIPTSDD